MSQTTIANQGDICYNYIVHKEEKNVKPFCRIRLILGIFTKKAVKKLKIYKFFTETLAFTLFMYYNYISIWAKIAIFEQTEEKQ